MDVTVSTTVGLVFLGVIGIMAGRLPKPIPIPRPGWIQVLLGLIGAIGGGVLFALMVMKRLPATVAELTATLFVGLAVGYLLSDFGSLLFKKE